MNRKKTFRNRALEAIAIIAFWSVFPLLFSFSSFLLYSQQEPAFSLSLSQSLLFELICISPWAVCTPLIIRLARRYPVGKTWNWQNTLVHMLLAFGVFSFHSLVQSYTVSLFFAEVNFSWSYIKADFLGFADMRILLYIGLLLGVYTVEFYQKNRESKLREPRLRAELDSLNFQKILNHVQPEFLINSIETIKRTIRISKKEADKNLNEISTLLRMMLQNIRRDEVTVKEDLEFMKLYLDITERRLGKKIQRNDIISHDCYNALIPNFLFILPFLEKLLELGPEKIDPFERFINKGWIEEGRLYLETVIADFDLESDDLAAIKEEVGMRDIVRRLQNKYDGTLDLSTFLKDRKIHIQLSLPYKKAGAETFIPYNKRVGDATEH